MKKRFLLIAAAILVIAAIAGCGGSDAPKTEEGTAPNQEEVQQAVSEVPEVPGKIADAGNVQALVPDGWKVFFQKDVLSENPDEMDPDVMSICKDATSDLDLFSKPYIQLNYYGPGTEMIAPEKDWYENAEDISAIQLGKYTWSGFTAKDSYGTMGILWTEDGENQYQATMWLEVEGGKISLEDEDVQAILASVKPSDGSAVVTAGSEETEEPLTEETADNGMEALVSRFQGDWNGALIFTDCTGIYEYLQEQWTSCLARFVIDEAGTVTPFIGLNVQDTPFTNLQAWLDTDMECMMLNGEWITVPFYETRITEYNGTINLEVYIENSGGSLCLVMNMRRLGDEGWTDEYPGLSAENIAYCRGKSFDELAVLNGYEPGDYPETGDSTGTAASVLTVDLGEKEGADGHVELAVLKELLPWMKTETDYGMSYEEIAAKFGVHGKYVNTFENNGEQFVRYRWSADDENRITITFYVNPDGSETWNVTTWDGLKD